VKTGRLHRNGRDIVPRALLARTWGARLRGLLLRPPLASDASEALVLEPCASIHTFGMRYPLDVVFVDAEGAVVGVRENVRPWRACMQRGARAVIEFHHGAVRRLSIVPGDQIGWR